MKRTHHLIALIALIAILAVSGQAAAVRQLRVDNQSAVGNCRVALASSEAAFRKRPLGMENESASPAFISCGLSAETASSRGISDVLLTSVINRGTVDVDFSCTLINGRAFPLGVSTAFTKAVRIPAGNGFGFLHWFAQDNGGNNFTTPNLSCEIPPNVEFNGTVTLYDTDVGN